MELVCGGRHAVRRADANLLFPRATTLSTAVIQARPLSAFAAGLLVLLLSGPVITLLAISVIGAAIVPVVVLAMFAGWLIGSIAVARWIGTSIIAQDDPDSRGQSTRSLLLGFVVKVVAYMIPLLGMTVWALTGVLGLGAATLALVGAFRAENPKRTPPAVPPPPLPGPGEPTEPFVPGPLPSPGAVPLASPPDELRAQSPVRDERAAGGAPPQGDLRRFPEDRSWNGSPPSSSTSSSSASWVARCSTFTTGKARSSSWR